MKINSLTASQKQDLERLNRYEHDGRVRDRIKAVLLKNEGWNNKAIAQALRIHEETVRQHVTDWLSDEKLKPENGGSYSKLSVHESLLLEKHIESTTYSRVIDICAYVETQFGVCYTVSGMTKWLKAHCFSYKQPKATPVKVDVAQQEAFIASYFTLLESALKNEPIVFMDSAPPTMATKVVCGWIRKGKDKPLVKTGAKTRVNVMGAIELSTMKVVSARPEQVNSETTVAFFEQLKAAYPDAQKIHIILDNSGYHCRQRVKDAALEKAIVLHYLPPYSPNLNPIERLWKVMNERVRNNRFFSSAKEFRGAIAEFFDSTLAKIAPFLRGRINDNFQTI
ncbi:IS630 family transposase [Candidatus Fukatsuia endosymbiont of Tuberolachnus salignus]|uniref:IS630 family transposase n=1 Tax=Candidatus Fukatsuia endosymbiont of Tuberolachnus salignus TaxID=3077957 RepID=UPI00313B5E2B